MDRLLPGLDWLHLVRLRLPPSPRNRARLSALSLGDARHQFNCHAINLPWRPLALIVCSGGVMPAIQFTCFDQVKALYIARLNDGSTQLSLAAGFVIGAIARTLADVVSYPVRVPQNIQQSSKHPLRYVHTRCCRLTLVESSARCPFAFLLIDNELNRSGERESHAVTTLTWHGVVWQGCVVWHNCEQCAAIRGHQWAVQGLCAAAVARYEACVGLL
jgi:hypothetical protein